MSKLSEILDFNPSRTIQRGNEAPFVDMASLPTSGRYISDIGRREYKGGGARFKNGDTLFARITPCLENGKTAKVTSLPDGEIAHGSTEFIVMSAKEPQYDENFVYYLARLPEFRKFAISHMEGTSGRQRVSWQALERFDHIFPEKSARKKAGEVLSAIDDKIELNQRMNETLERMARSIFKSWFVDFVPVHAKAEGREPEGMDARTAALFPSTFTPDGLPEGWEETKFEKCFDFTMGQSPPGDSYNEEQRGIAFYQGRRDFGFRYPENRVYSTAPKRYAHSGDTLLSVRAPVGDLNMAIEDCCIGRGLSAIRHKLKGRSFTYYAMLNMQPMFDAYNSEGTVFGSVNKTSLGNLTWLEPSKEIVSAFEEIAENLDQKIRNNEKQNQTLAALRDTLLPKLISGELRVEPATEELKEAVG